MKSSVLSEDAVLTIKEMYEERDARGRRVYSHMSLAKRFAVSETTILRVLNGYGTFIRAPKPVADTPEIRAAADLSAQKLLAMLKNEEDNQGRPDGLEVKPDPNQRIDPADGRTERLDPVSGKWFKLHY